MGGLLTQFLNTEITKACHYHQLCLKFTLQSHRKSLFIPGSYHRPIEISSGGNRVFAVLKGPTFHSNVVQRIASSEPATLLEMLAPTI